MTIISGTRRFDSLSWKMAAEAAAMEGSTLVWPFGACEQHGPHLPLATDNLFAEQIAEQVLTELPQSFPIWMLPSQAIGFSPEHASFPGTISLSAGLLLQLILEVGQQLGSIGISRLLLFNAHGGQIALLQTAARELRLKCPSMAVFPCFLWGGVDSLNDLIPSSERQHGLHAALAETSLMLSLAPNLVGPDRPIDGDHQSKDSLQTPPTGWSLEGPTPYAWLTKDLSDSGVIGDSTSASSSLGKEIKTALVRHWLSLITNLLESKWPSI